MVTLYPDATTALVNIDVVFRRQRDTEQIQLIIILLTIIVLSEACEDVYVELTYNSFCVNRMLLISTFLSFV